MSIRSRIRTIPDYPKPGIQFRDMTTLLQDPVGMRIAVEQLVAPYKGLRVDKVAAIEARGFILGGAAAVMLEAGFVPVRKKGKLPWETIGQDYELEYGSDCVEIHTDSILEAEQILVIDDLIATGGTVCAAIDLIERVGGEIMGCAFVVDLPELGGSAKLEARGLEPHVLVEFEGE